MTAKRKWEIVGFEKKGLKFEKGEHAGDPVLKRRQLAIERLMAIADRVKYPDDPAFVHSVAIGVLMTSSKELGFSPDQMAAVFDYLDREYRAYVLLEEAPPEHGKLN